MPPTDVDSAVNKKVPKPGLLRVDCEMFGLWNVFDL
jgi:hypothetical protein